MYFIVLCIMYCYNVFWTYSSLPVTFFCLPSPPHASPLANEPPSLSCLISREPINLIRVTQRSTGEELFIEAGQLVVSETFCTHFLFCNSMFQCSIVPISGGGMAGEAAVLTFDFKADKQRRRWGERLRVRLRHRWMDQVHHDRWPVEVIRSKRWSRGSRRETSLHGSWRRGV